MANEKLNMGIYRNSTFYPLPRPLPSVRVQLAWDHEKKKAIRKDGEQISGVSRNALEIQISGLLAIDTDTPRIYEEDMFALWSSLVTNMDVDNNTKFELFLYYRTTGTPYYRKFKRVSPASLTFDMGDQARVPFQYTATFLAEDPVIYTTAPGA